MFNTIDTYRAKIVATSRRVILYGTQWIQYCWRIANLLEQRAPLVIPAAQHIAVRIWCVNPSQWFKRWRATK